MLESMFQKLEAGQTQVVDDLKNKQFENPNEKSGNYQLR